MEALAQGAVFVRVAQFAQEPANVVCPSPGVFDQGQGGGERERPLGPVRAHDSGRGRDDLHADADADSLTAGSCSPFG